MAAVIVGLQQLPDNDIAAIATYLTSLSTSPEAAQPATVAHAEAVEILTRTTGTDLPASAAARLYDGACGVCHEPMLSPGQLAAVPLAYSTKFHAERPVNLLRVVLDGVPAGHGGDEQAIAAFRASLNGRQIAQLTAYVRERFAPDEPPWTDLATTVAQLR